MKCDPITKRYTIKVPKDNSIKLILPLKTRTYVSNVPIDEAIVYAELEDVVLTIGGTEYPVALGLQGVEVNVPLGLPLGVYDIIMTAIYHGAQIRAAYFEAITSVDWNYQSDVQQYLQGSPIVADAAFVIGGPLTDAELEQLKEQYHGAIEAANEREAEAQAKVEEYAEKIEELDDLATKQDLAGLAEKTDLADLATKQDIAGLAEKTDLEGLATAQNVTDAKNEILAALPQAAPIEFIRSLFANES